MALSAASRFASSLGLPGGLRDPQRAAEHNHVCESSPLQGHVSGRTVGSLYSPSSRHCSLDSQEQCHPHLLAKNAGKLTEILLHELVYSQWDRFYSLTHLTASH